MRAQRGDAVAPRDHVAHPQTGRGKDLRERTDEHGVATRDEVGRRDRLPRERRERLVDHKARPRRERGEDRTQLLDRESGVEGKSVDLGGRRIIKKKKKEERKY